MSRIIGVGMPLVLLMGLAGACGGSDQSGREGAESASADSAASASAARAAEPRVSNVMIGSQMGAGGRISVPSFEFTPKDTVHLSVTTEGAAEGARLTAAWRSQTGEVLQQSAEAVPSTGENTVFHLSRPNGLKPGTYKVVVFLGPDSVDTKVFAVRK